MGINYTAAFDGITRGLGNVAQMMNIYHGIRDREDKRVEREEEKAYRDKVYNEGVRRFNETYKLDVEKFHTDEAYRKKALGLQYAQHNFNVRKYNDEQAQREYERQVMRDIYIGNGFSQEEADRLDNEYGSNTDGITFNPTTNFVIGSEYGGGKSGEIYGHYSGNDANGNPVAVPIAMSRGEDGRPNIREIGEAMPLAEAQQKFADTGAKLEQEGQAAMAEQQQQPKSLAAGINPMQIKRTLTDKDIKAKQTEIRMDKIANKIPLTAEEQSFMSLNPDDFKKPANPAVAELKAKQTEIRMNKIANDIPLTEAEQAIMSQNPDVIGRPVQPAADAQEPTQSEPQPSKDAGAFQRLSSPNINTAERYSLGKNVKSMGKVKTPKLSDEQANDRINKLAMIATSQYTSSEDKKMAREALEAIRYFGKNKAQSIPDMIEAYEGVSAQNKAMRDKENEVVANYYGEQRKDQLERGSNITIKRYESFRDNKIKNFSTGNKENQLKKETVASSFDKAYTLFNDIIDLNSGMLADSGFNAGFDKVMQVLNKHPEWDATMAYAFVQKHGTKYKDNEDDAKTISDAVAGGYKTLDDVGIGNPRYRVRVSSAAVDLVLSQYDGDFSKYEQALTDVLKELGGR